MINSLYLFRIGSVVICLDSISIDQRGHQFATNGIDQRLWRSKQKSRIERLITQSCREAHRREEIGPGNFYVELCSGQLQLRLADIRPVVQQLRRDAGV